MFRGSIAKDAEAVGHEVCILSLEFVDLKVESIPNAKGLVLRAVPNILLSTTRKLFSTYTVIPSNWAQ